jgi:hypothetical protein
VDTLFGFNIIGKAMFTVLGHMRMRASARALQGGVSDLLSIF